MIGNRFCTKNLFNTTTIPLPLIVRYKIIAQKYIDKTPGFRRWGEKKRPIQRITTSFGRYLFTHLCQKQFYSSSFNHSYRGCAVKLRRVAILYIVKIIQHIVSISPQTFSPWLDTIQGIIIIIITTNVSWRNISFAANRPRRMTDETTERHYFFSRGRICFFSSFFCYNNIRQLHNDR